MSGKPWSNHGQKDLAILAQDGKEMGVHEKPHAKVLGDFIPIFWVMGLREILK